jgi:hypothetical protein
MQCDFYTLGSHSLLDWQTFPLCGFEKFLHPLATTLFGPLYTLLFDGQWKETNMGGQVLVHETEKRERIDLISLEAYPVPCSALSVDEFKVTFKQVYLVKRGPCATLWCASNFV